MTRTYHDIKIVEDGYTHRCKNGSVELENGAVYSTHTTTAQNLVNRFGVAKYVGNKYQLDRGEEDYTIKKVVDEEETADENDQDFDFEAYVDSNNADQVIRDVKETTEVAWLENVRAVDDRKTVAEAIDDRIEELEE